MFFVEPFTLVGKSVKASHTPHFLSSQHFVFIVVTLVQFWCIPEVLLVFFSWFLLLLVYSIFCLHLFLLSLGITPHYYTAITTTITTFLSTTQYCSMYVIYYCVLLAVQIHYNIYYTIKFSQYRIDCSCRVCDLNICLFPFPVLLNLHTPKQRDLSLLLSVVAVAVFLLHIVKVVPKMDIFLAINIFFCLEAEQKSSNSTHPLYNSKSQLWT